jgi:hypothetical protein
VAAPLEGQIIGMAYPQVVLPGFALFHVGTPALEEARVAPSR